MEKELISKKELREKYAISYGALYRWKRQGLIPEDWLIKKSTVTGQETFFPTQLICERVELIQSMKGETTLADLLRQLSREERDKEAIVIKTLMGEKRFYLTDIQEIFIEKGEGRIIDITREILEM